MTDCLTDYHGLLKHCKTSKQREAVELLAAGMTARQAGDVLGVVERKIHERVARVRVLAGSDGQHQSGVQIDELPDEIDVGALLEERKRKFRRKTEFEESRKLLSARVKIPGPIGILFFGDPHVDDDGTDIAALERHARLVRETEGLFGANVGDSSNNWVGRLAKLYGEQSTSAAESWALVEWFIREVRDWLFLLSGNHDAWSGAGDPIRWMTKQAGNLYETNVRMRLNFPKGDPVTINARHDFSGHSLWNPAHGVGRSVQQGMWDDIAVCGHRHVSGYMILKSPADGRACHAIQVATYKLFDRYARDKGFRDQNISPAVVAIIDPERPHTSPGRIRIEHDVEEGVDLLKWKRARAA